MVSAGRRHLLSRLGLPAVAWLAGCAATPGDESGAEPAPAGDADATWRRSARRISGGFLAPPGAPGGALPRLGAGAFVRLQSPGPLAVRGFDLLAGDVATGRLWRIDAALQTMTPVAAVAIGPRSALWLGPDRSAWVLDPPTRQALRFAADGRLLQTWRSAGPAPTGLAVMDAGATLVVGDAAFAQWSELRSGGATTLAVLPRRGDGARISGVDALAGWQDQIAVLDRAAAAVHRVQRDGRVLASAEDPALAGAQSLALDRHRRAWVIDATGTALLALSLAAPGAAVRRWSAEALGLQRLGGLAVDDRQLALADPLAGEVHLWTLPPP